jgi:aspartate/methionine/tyrosine aminotransferase
LAKKNLEIAPAHAGLEAGATLTRHQWEALRGSFNLADGHSRQHQSAEQLEFLQQLPDLFLECVDADQEVVETEFLEAFFDIGGQPSFLELPRPNLHYSASISIAVAAAHLRALGGVAMVIHPTFDNIPALLSRHGVPMRPVSFEEILRLESFPDDVTALMLVLPNNPTGDCLGPEELATIASLCAAHGVNLVIDFSFRFASELCAWDQYSVLSASGADFLCIEDTGKTWPVLDLKVGITVSSPDVALEIQEITEDYILNVSPFLLKLLTLYIASDPERSWRTIAEKNRLTLENALVGSEASLEPPGSAATISWIDLGEGWESDGFCRWANDTGVAVCPGGPFFWDAPERGKRFMRVALLRPHQYFAEAASTLRRLIDDYGAGAGDGGSFELAPADAS